MSYCHHILILPWLSFLSSPLVAFWSLLSWVLCHISTVKVIMVTSHLLPVEKDLSSPLVHYFRCKQTPDYQHSLQLVGYLRIQSLLQDFSIDSNEGMSFVVRNHFAKVAKITLVIVVRLYWRIYIKITFELRCYVCYYTKVDTVYFYWFLFSWQLLYRKQKLQFNQKQPGKY
jgi:hypothetical protein